MSWDARLNDLTVPGSLAIGDWNYTHNTSPMIYTVLTDVLGCVNEPECQTRWYERLNGCSGPEGAEYLHQIITALEADPDRFTAMNPSNGWGSYEGLVKILTEMRNAVPEWPTRWETCG